MKDWLWLRSLFMNNEKIKYQLGRMAGDMFKAMKDHVRNNMLLDDDVLEYEMEEVMEQRFNDFCYENGLDVNEVNDYVENDMRRWQEQQDWNARIDAEKEKRNERKRIS